jgi:hypothetical protein
MLIADVEHVIQMHGGWLYAAFAAANAVLMLQIMRMSAQTATNRVKKDQFTDKKPLI